MSLRTTEDIKIDRVSLLEKKKDRKVKFSHATFALPKRISWIIEKFILICHSDSCLSGVMSGRDCCAEDFPWLTVASVRKQWQQPIFFFYFFFKEEKMGQGDRREPEYLILFVINTDSSELGTSPYKSLPVSRDLQFPWQKPRSIANGEERTQMYSGITVLL